MADAIAFRSTGFGTTPCPGCRLLPQPGQDLVTRPGEWLAWHAECYEIFADPVQMIRPDAALIGHVVCRHCTERHAAPYDGSCLL